MVESMRKVRESELKSEWWREKVYVAAEILACGGGRLSGGLRLWKVLEMELKPVVGSIELVMMCSFM